MVVASRGATTTHPAWFLNLRDRPDVQVAVQGGPRQLTRARIATAEERARKTCFFACRCHTLCKLNSVKAVEWLIN